MVVACPNAVIWSESEAKRQWFAVQVRARREKLVQLQSKDYECFLPLYTTKSALLGLSAKTVEAHRSRVMKKLQINETAHLVRYAIRQGLLSA